MREWDSLNRKIVPRNKEEQVWRRKRAKRKTEEKQRGPQGEGRQEGRENGKERRKKRKEKARLYRAKGEQGVRRRVAGVWEGTGACKGAALNPLWGGTRLEKLFSFATPGWCRDSFVGEGRGGGVALCPEWGCCGCKRCIGGHRIYIFLIFWKGDQYFGTKIDTLTLNTCLQSLKC